MTRPVVPVDTRRMRIWFEPFTNCSKSVVNVRVRVLLEAVGVAEPMFVQADVVGLRTSRVTTSLPEPLVALKAALKSICRTGKAVSTGERNSVFTPATVAEVTRTIDSFLEATGPTSVPLPCVVPVSWKLKGKSDEAYDPEGAVARMMRVLTGELVPLSISPLAVFRVKIETDPAVTAVG